jgi:pimeloyl-ACP methyl ester carboxylesterase
MFKRWILVALVVGLALALGMGGEQSAAAPGEPKVAWSPCYKDFGPFECGSVQVPLDYDSPNGAAISIAMVRLPATDPGHRIGSLFLNPGGPGGSGVDFTLFAGPFLYSDEVRAKFDLVGFDPRGIQRSTAFRCFGNPKQWEPFFTPFAFPLTPAEEAIWITADRYLVDACDQRGGRIADHMSTANVARDLDLLRQAVGDEMLTYAGYSYGSFLGTTYANLFPSKVRAVVVDGVLDPIAWTTGVGNEAQTTPFSTRLRSDAGAMATLNEFFRLCDAGPCAFGPDSAARYADLAADVLADPTVIDYSGLIATTLGAMYDSASWEDFAELLADLESATASSATLSARIESFRLRPMYITKRGFPHYPNFVEGFPGVICADSDNPSSYAAWSAAGAAADAAFGYFGRIWTWVSSVCAEWYTSDDDRYPGPFTASTANPVLVVGTRYDPATRYEGALTVDGLLPNSRLLTVNGWGHTSLFLSQCADAIVSTYLLTTSAPASTECAQDFTPFAPQGGSRLGARGFRAVGAELVQDFDAATATTGGGGGGDARTSRSGRRGGSPRER